MTQPRPSVPGLNLSKLNPNAADFLTKMQQQQQQQEQQPAKQHQQMPPNFVVGSTASGSNRLQQFNQNFTSRSPPVHPGDVASARG
jgi:hypothetical protein